MKKVSVIIPNFNGYKYSGRCLKALENQTFKDFDVCIVDDCSTDDSYSKLLEYANQSPLCIKIIKSDKNLGPGHSRKVGLESTNSEWVAFCDIDDWYDEDFLTIQLKNAEQNNADLVLCDNTFVYEDDRRVKANVTSWAKSRTVDKKTLLALGKMSLCRLLCKRYLFEQIVIPDIYYGEDAPVTVQLIARSNKQYVDNNAYYNYFVRADSASSNPRVRAVDDYQKAYDIIYNELHYDFPVECEYIGINMILYGKTLVMQKTNHNKKEIISTIESFEGIYPNWKKNVYLSELDIKKRIYLWAINAKLLTICRILANIHGFMIKKKKKQ